MSNFKLNIALNNEAMLAHSDLAETLVRLAERVGSAGAVEGFVKDANGNTVGSWEIYDEDDNDSEPYENDVAFDSDTLASAGYGTDEDYGYYGE
jgi:hypothetical protein